MPAPTPAKGSSGRLASTIIVGLLSLIVLSGTFHIVPPGNRGVVVRLGRVDPIQRGEGLMFKVPFMDNVIDYPVMQLTGSGKADSFSSDLQNMTIEFTVFYRVPESQVVALFQQYKGDPYLTLIEPRVQESIKQITAGSRAEDLVKNREKMKEDVHTRLSQAVGDVLRIVDVSITNIDLSNQLEQAIEQKVVREQEALAKSFELEREKKEAEITIVKAEAEAKAVSIKGEALKASPQVVDFEIAQRWDGKAPLSVAVGRGGANVLLPIQARE